MRAHEPIVSVVVYGAGWKWLPSALVALHRDTCGPWEPPPVAEDLLDSTP